MRALSGGAWAPIAMFLWAAGSREVVGRPGADAGRGAKVGHGGEAAAHTWPPDCSSWNPNPNVLFLLRNASSLHPTPSVPRSLVLEINTTSKNASNFAVSLSWG